MAIIYSYPLNQPKRDDLLIGTITYDEDAVTQFMVTQLLVLL